MHNNNIRIYIAANGYYLTDERNILCVKDGVFEPSGESARVVVKAPGQVHLTPSSERFFDKTSGEFFQPGDHVSVLPQEEGGVIILDSVGREIIRTACLPRSLYDRCTRQYQPLVEEYSQQMRIVERQFARKLQEARMTLEQELAAEKSRITTPEINLLDLLLR